MILRASIACRVRVAPPSTPLGSASTCSCPRRHIFFRMRWRMNQLNDLKHEEYCYLTTMGRITGKPHEIEIWFGLNDFTLYLLSGGGIKSDWVKNLLKVSNV